MLQGENTFFIAQPRKYETIYISGGFAEKMADFLATPLALIQLILRNFTKPSLPAKALKNKDVKKVKVKLLNNVQ